MKFEKTWTVLSVFVLCLLALAEALTVAIILKMNMLPLKYVAVLVVLMAILVLVEALFLLVRVNGTVALSRRVIACVLAVLLVGFCAYISRNVALTYRVLDKVTNVPINTELSTDGKDMCVLVRKDDPAKELKDTVDYSYGMIENHDVNRVEKFITWIGKQTGKAPEPAGFVHAKELANALLDKKVDAIIISGATLSILMEEEDYADFLDKVQIMAAISYSTLEGKDPQQEKPVEDKIDPEKNVTNSPFVIYISGSDTRSSVLDRSRSDVNILMVVNPTTKQILLLNTPRDYYVGNPHYDGALDKLTHCGLFGVDCSMEALGNLYGTEIKYYGQINFTGFETLIDSVGGITVHSDKSFMAWDTPIKKGENFLNGKQALNFARERYHVSGGDNDRGKNQMKVIEAVIKKMTTGTTIISNYAAIMESLEGMFATNMQSAEISMLVKMQLNDLASWDVLKFAVTGTGGSEITASMPGVTAYVMHPDQKSVDHARSLVEKILSGTKLKKEDMEVPK